MPTKTRKSERPPESVSDAPTELSKGSAAAPSLSAYVVPIIAIAVTAVGMAMTMAMSMPISASTFCNAMPSVCHVLGLAHHNSMGMGMGMDMDVPVQNTDADTSINLEFYNRLPYDVHTYWKDFDGAERFWFAMEAFSYHGNISTVPGHVWLFKLASTEQVLFEEMIDIRHCGKIMIAPPEHVEALRQYCRDTGRAVLGHWPRAPVVREMHALLPVSSETVVTTEHVQFRDEPSRSSSPWSMTMRTLSRTPHVLEIDDFLSHEECEHLQELALASDDFGKQHQDDDDQHAGSSIWIEHGETPIVSAISRRLFDVMGFDDDVETFFFAEKLQISRMDEGDSYAPHFDAMDVTTTQRHLPHNRYATLLMYLNDVHQHNGGADVFPRANFRDEYAKHACESEFRIQPRKGQLVIVYSMLKDGNIDETALHGSCAVQGQHAHKWTSSMYLWDPFVQWND